jgi:hypothetical protein
LYPYDQEKELVSKTNDTEARAAYARIREELLGDSFSSVNDLRHRAENAGFNFVPVEVVDGGDRQIEIALRPPGMPEVRVRATRARIYHPFYITAVELAET